jgi:hypothetical protein
VVARSVEAGRPEVDFARVRELLDDAELRARLGAAGREATERTPAVTKLDVVKYYLAVGDGIMRALERRPTTLERWPKGVHPGIVVSTSLPKRSTTPRSNCVMTRMLDPASSRTIGRSAIRRLRKRCAAIDASFGEWLASEFADWGEMQAALVERTLPAGRRLGVVTYSAAKAGLIRFTSSVRGHVTDTGSMPSAFPW